MLTCSSLITTPWDNPSCPATLNTIFIGCTPSLPVSSVCESNGYSCKKKLSWLFLWPICVVQISVKYFKMWQQLLKKSHRPNSKLLSYIVFITTPSINISSKWSLLLLFQSLNIWPGWDRKFKIGCSKVPNMPAGNETHRTPGLIFIWFNFNMFIKVVL